MTLKELNFGDTLTKKQAQILFLDVRDTHSISKLRLSGGYILACIAKTNGKHEIHHYGGWVGDVSRAKFGHPTYFFIKGIKGKKLL